MLYSYLKIFHIVSAALLLASMAYSYRLWKLILTPHSDGDAQIQRIESQTWLVIIPCAILQLATGFSMISAQHENLSSFWIGGSVVGFMVAMGSWFSFLYFLLLGQQLSPKMQRHPRLVENKYKFFRRAQSTMLIICLLALSSMVFLMANKVA